jgi:hypothetical protein
MLILLAMIVSCSDANKNAYAQAAVGTGILLGAVGMHRVLTNDRWARCSPGHLCTQESGLCEAGDCAALTSDSGH